jgi:hypothetical protein
MDAALQIMRIESFPEENREQETSSSNRSADALSASLCVAARLASQVKEPEPLFKLLKGQFIGPGVPDEHRINTAGIEADVDTSKRRLVDDVEQPTAKRAREVSQYSGG